MTNDKNPKKIVIVEDELIIAADLAAKLTRLGYEIAGTAMRGAEAIALAHACRPDIVLMDIRLAGPMDGIEAAAAIRSAHDVPVVYLTAHSDPATLERARQTDPFGYIIKPFEEREVQAHIEMALYRHQMTRQLRESREDLNHAQAVAHVGSWRLNTGRNELVWSDEIYRMFGVSAGTPLTYETFLNAVHPADRAIVEEKWAAALRGEPYDLEHRIVAGGTVKWVRECAELEFDGTGALLGGFGTAHDITELKALQRQEQEAAVRQARGQSAMDTIRAMSEGVLLLKIDGLILSVNPAVTRLSGFAAETVVGRRIDDLLPDLLSGADLAAARNGMEAVRSGRIPALPPLRMKRPDGKTLHVLPGISLLEVSPEGPPVAVLTIRDVTELHEATQQLEQSERKYRELVENTSSIIMRLTPDHTITFFNEYAQSFFGYAAEEVIGRSVLDTIVPETDSEGRNLREMLRAITADPELYKSNENEAVCRDGRRVWIHWTNRAVRDEQGNFVETLCVGTDITRRREMELQALQYQKRLCLLARRLAAAEEENRWQISRYIHDTIIQNLSLSCMRLGGLVKPLTDARLKAEIKVLSQCRELIEQAMEECRSVMTDLTPSLLYELGLVPALRDFAERVKVKHGAQMDVEVSGQEIVLADSLRGLLFQSARELVMNAMKHAGPCTIRVTVINRNGELGIHVTDNGRGFNPAADAKLARQGGFGLFNVQLRLEGLGGRIEIESVPGSGTTAKISLPLQEDEGAPLRLVS